MYPVTEEYKKAISESSRSFFWAGMITTKQGKKYIFENKDIVKGSGYISRQCSGSSEIELGSEDEAYEKPDFLGEEVTGDKRYYNKYMLNHPYREWKDK